MKSRRLFLTSLLASLLMVACVVPTWVTQAENIARGSLPIVESILVIVDPPAGPLVQAISAAFNVLANQLDAFKSNPNDTTLQAVETQLTALQSQLAQVEQAAHITDPKSQQEFQQIVALLQQEIQQIQGSIQAQKKVGARKKVARVPGSKTAAEFKAQYNRIVAGDTRFKQL